jgi:hypothetical protein
MGALDWLKEWENRTLDAAAFSMLKRNYEMLEENGRLHKEKAQLLEADVKRLTEENTRLQTENAELRNSVRDQCFDIQDGIAFKRIEDGDYDETPYCPNCHTAMSTSTGRSFVCPKCKYARANDRPLQALLGKLRQRISEA